MEIFREMKFIIESEKGNSEYAVSDLYGSSGVTPADVVRELSYFNLITHLAQPTLLWFNCSDAVD